MGYLTTPPVTLDLSLTVRLLNTVISALLTPDGLQKYYSGLKIVTRQPSTPKLGVFLIIQYTASKWRQPTGFRWRRHCTFSCDPGNIITKPRETFVCMAALIFIARQSL